MTNIPGATPDTGVKAVAPSVGFNPDVTHSIHSAHVNSTQSTSHSTSTSSSSSILSTSSLSLPISHTETSSPATHSATSAPESSTSESSGPKIPVAEIVALSVGSFLVLLSLLIFLKACCIRPKRYNRPTPSLPILNENYGVRDFGDVHEKESPIFGGKERFSAPDWPSWANDNQANSYIRLEDAIPMPPTYADPHAKQHQSNDSQAQLLSSIPSYPSFPSNPGTAPPMQSLPSVPQLPSAHQPSRNNPMTRNISRFSAASLSLYPTSPISVQDIQVGLAISSSKPFAADDHAFLTRQNTKETMRRSRSEADGMEWAYDGADVASPKIIMSPQVPATTNAGGRSRIRSSYYTPGSYPRISTIPSSTSSRLRAGDDVGSLYSAYPPPPPPVPTRMDGLGLTSPGMGMPVSPQPTLYPDDSLSMVGVRPSVKRTMSSKRVRGDEGEEDTGTALGSLMLNMDFGTTTRSLAGLASQNQGHSQSHGGGLGTSASSSHVRTGSRPPRVPSPPPLPSLAQMGLEHSDPAGFAEYRSPTYSIFGMYGEDEGQRRGTKASSFYLS
ncbi:hypothetical protein CYLTODRAFT_440802 [Cylindrobasidium torrendii FP15055 ss-10]|uniref:Uncharacterized protein n=1 Tax=Cylindrobasidium torrendii FP15055 ss-10 TaxID=1314674 RepID=A0A0D7BPZ2_9AGAR|nr:hypothetical protein CYLTODRAFT_440802 [Cylindrobasidium torrendii FP15055 ss-10]